MDLVKVNGYNEGNIISDEGVLIGYYEKHEYRDRETAKLYDL